MIWDVKDFITKMNEIKKKKGKSFCIEKYIKETIQNKLNQVKKKEKEEEKDDFLKKFVLQIW